MHGAFTDAAPMMPRRPAFVTGEQVGAPRRGGEKRTYTHPDAFVELGKGG
jgi:hypothetical protein